MLGPQVQQLGRQWPLGLESKGCQRSLLFVGVVAPVDQPAGSLNQFFLLARVNSNM
jgi:hypothetical protein